MYVVYFYSSRRRHTRCALVAGVQTWALPISSGRRSRRYLRDPHPRIERAVEQVDCEIDEDEHEDSEHQVGDDHRAVEMLDRVDEQLAHARPGEDRLDRKTVV